MAPNAKMRESTRQKEFDPRDLPGEGAKVIDLATRNVMPRVTQRKRSDGLGLAAGVGIVAVLGAVTLWSMDAARNAQPEEQRIGIPANASPGASAAPVAATSPRLQSNPAVRPSTLAAPNPSPVLSRPPEAGMALAPSGNRYASPTVVFDAGAAGVPAAAIAGIAPNAGKGDPSDDFAARIGGVGGSTATAAATFDPRTTVTQGTLIPAVLETAIDTSVPGYVRAIVSTDVRSFDGARVLVPRSSRLVGQYKSGTSAGQKRAYVVWTRLIRPDGVSVDLGSPAVGFDGQTGLGGKVDSHFFERFGSAMLLSVVGGLSALGGNAGIIIGGSGQSAAAAAVTQGGSIGPTIRVRQGEPIRVFTARDLDFSKVK